MSQKDVAKETFTLYNPLPRKLQKDKTLLQVPKDPKEFVTSFLRAVTPRRRDEQLEKLSSRKEMVMDAIKSRRKSERRRGRKKKALSSIQKKQLNMKDIPPELQKYEMYEPLHQLWLDYMRDSLQLKHPTVTAEHLHIKLLRCDLHGSIMTVTKSKCPSYIGQSGIVVQESRNAFKMITKANSLKTIPKASTIFTMTIDNLVINIYGNHLRYRAGDRANRKFKIKPTIDL
ncbi:ribonuclease P protein subunit p29-like [Acanthaster planci]|uniref:Ribonuclease P protein subunit p29 n=1 Tax=Acanthaster planci TaxID=133434 RepID=A0A8B7YHQ2_ACAPL|nr:ribonuclease P protein subunit p29-like [Acanthaster planci]